MKQLLPLFLLLFPCLAMAQYQGNANQKITLGEQTTADGLVYRGVANLDTVAATSKITRANKQDTSAYILLDTVTNLLWHYKIGSNAWTQAGGGDTSLIAYVNTYGTQTVNGAKTFTSELTATRFNPTANTANGTGMFLPAANTLGFSTNGTEKVRITSGGNVGIGTQTPQSYTNYRILHLAGPATNGAGLLYLTNSDNSIVGMAFAEGGEQRVTYGSQTNHPVTFITFDTERMRISSAGNVGINTTNPLEKLHVVGNARITGAYDVTTGSASNVFVTTDGVLQRSTSSIKYKTDVEDYSKGLKEVMKLRPVTFKSINSNNDKTYAGFIAEELADLKLNELVENNDSGEPDAISYAYMVTLLTKAIQEQQEQISQLKKRLFILENK